MITDIRLQNFRSYSDESFELSPGVNIIVGANASGKTNLLEAILVNCLGSSYRAKDTELVGFEKPWARIDIHTDTGSRAVKLESQPSGVVRKSYEIEDQKFVRLSLQKTIPVVLFEPNHLLLMTGGPELRRDYIDNLLEQTVPGFINLRKQYRRAVSQRNALLKQGPATKMQLFAWNIRLSELGGEIVKHRLALVEQINQDIEQLYQSLSHTKTKVVLKYQTNCLVTQYSSDLLHKLEAATDLDFARGFTTYGPHRDDLVVLLDGHTMQTSASRGETRTILLALKVLELRILESLRGQKPILLLDDVFSELDGARRRALTSYLEPYQTFLTTTDADVVVEHFLASCNVIPLG